ncbi:hypothetical protein CLOM_g10979 [Closterium sp. NIES-68]|nr:hypothetical protein CLOM_g10979 [Closterium sp. NIES-68]GJP86019.1 hypothetical protein CLOP_g16089 [Closterium sp. NIES-67]
MLDAVQQIAVRWVSPNRHLGHDRSRRVPLEWQNRLATFASPKPLCHQRFPGLSVEQPPSGRASCHVCGGWEQGLASSQHLEESGCASERRAGFQMEGHH